MAFKEAILLVESVLTVLNGQRLLCQSLRANWPNMVFKEIGDSLRFYVYIC